ncbi:Tyrosyl-tRNA synthetase [Streptococcus suis 05ZYH33]|nr:Tyrosyl-tRNA synthetase [Streptococcus suis 05ZYH33]
MTLVHGEEAYNQALNITEQLYAGNIKNLSAKRTQTRPQQRSKLRCTG